MSGTAQARTRGPSAQSGARRGPTRLVVGDHVGQPAGEAAQAVRRAGMRPALDRSFGYNAAETGLVVEQDPAAGTEVARNAMVTLYVAAPAPGPTTHGRAEAGPGEQDVEHRDASSDDTAAALLPEDSSERSRPRRVVMPQATEADVAEDLVTAGGDAEQATEVDDRPPSVLDDPFTHDAGGAARFRQVYPRRPVALTLRGARMWLWRHRFATLGAFLLAAVIAGHTTSSRPARRAGIGREAPLAAVMATPARTPRHERRRAVVSRTVPSRRGPRQHSAAVRPGRARAAAAAVPDSAPASAPSSNETTSEAAGGPFSP